MKNIFKNITYNKITNIHLVYVFMFLAAFTIRFFASQKLPINSYEASILLKITDETSIYPDGFSVIEYILIKMSFFVFGESDLGARMWPVIAGSILTLLPLYLREQLNNKIGVVMSLFIVVDPFLIVNSMQIGSNIFAFLAFAFLFGAIWKNDYFGRILFLLMLFSSGRGKLLAMILCIIFLVYQKMHGVYVLKDLIEETKKWGKIKIYFQFQKYLIIGLFLAFTIAFFGLDISLIHSDLISNLENFLSKYTVGSSPLAFLVILFSYLPFFIFIFIYRTISVLRKGKRPKKLFIFWIIFALLFLLINPYHKAYDMLWVSGLLLVFTALNTPDVILGKKDKDINNLIRISYFLVLLVALLMNFAIFIYQGYSGLSQSQTSISIITIIIVTTASVIFLDYQLGLKYSLLGFMSATFILLFVMQLGSSFRASGLANSRYAEMLWSGVINDKQIIQDQINNVKITKKLASDSIKFGLIDMREPGVLWELRPYEVNSFSKEFIPNEKFDILISKTESIEQTGEKYFGLEFIADSFPRWSIEPIKSLFSYDYWSWLIFRKSQMQKTLNYIWVIAD